MRWAGGWLFDQVMAGWEAVVLTADGTDPRPLRILGARPLDLATDLATSLRPPGPQALAVDARFCESDERVRALVLSTLDSRTAEVRLWGDHWPAGLDDTAGTPRQHRLSVAAQAFKAQAMTAAVAGASTGADTEVFHGVRHHARTTLVSVGPH
ncbi:hypothetical protein [Actinophytocola oryzae]|uniref:Uncharacterized protein n=1 Tax=Actinophytocola oryzae TaxID=502181 RepID=A0A4R7VKR7_9PSEU|nr:hypothetical protein [Actinophytocola oryzae]TDV49855.1 hypothetical protein CLV71_107203 [Actinophytocola oryzae]